MEAIILAGGLGTRLKKVVSDVPKPLAPIAGIPFLEYQLAFWGKWGVTRVILSVGHLWEKIQSHFSSRFRGIDIIYSVENYPLGTGGGLRLAIEKLREKVPFLVLNGDSFVDVSLMQLGQLHQARKADVTFTLVKVENAQRYGNVALDTEGKILTLESKVRESKSGLINAGVYLFNQHLLDLVPNDEKISLEEDILPEFMRSRKKLYGMVTSGTFIDIGVPEDYAKAASVLSAYNPRLGNAS